MRCGGTFSRPSQCFEKVQLVRGLDSTYEGLKLRRQPTVENGQIAGLDSTYEGLKPGRALDEHDCEIPVWTLPMRD